MQIAKVPVSRMLGDLEVLFEDNHLLVVNKPALISTMGGTGQDSSLVDRVKEYIRQRYAKPGNVYIGVVSRLDSWVTGVIVFARTSKAAARLNEQFRTRQVEKKYLAIVAQLPGAAGDDRPVGIQRDWIRKNESEHRMEILLQARHVANAKTDQDLESHGYQLAELESRMIQSNGDRLLLEIELVTGRKHQIRAQLSARGWPVVGDRKYGSRVDFATGIALHSRSLSILHPTSKKRLDIRANLPGYWPEFAKKAV